MGVAWLGDTFVKAHISDIQTTAGSLLQSYPWMLAVVLFFAAMLLYSQAATAKALMPAVSALFVLPTYPNLLAAVEMDDTGSTRIGKYVFNHSFLIPGVLTISLSVAFGFIVGHIVVIASLLMTSGVQAAGWQDSLSSAASQLGQNGASSGNLTGLLSGGTSSLSAGTMTNAAGIMQYCIKQKLVSATNTENIKNQVMEKLDLGSAQAQKKETDYIQGLAGMLKTGDGQQFNLNNIGSTPLAEKVKTKACDLVLKQGVKFIS